MSPSFSFRFPMLDVWRMFAIILIVSVNAKQSRAVSLADLGLPNKPTLDSINETGRNGSSVDLFSSYGRLGLIDNRQQQFQNSALLTSSDFPKGAPRDSDCWQTGCQPNDWAVVGCDWYGRQEIGRVACTDDRGVDGFLYDCCCIAGQASWTCDGTADNPK